MTKPLHSTSPRPTAYRVQQYGALALLIVILIAIPFQLFLGLALKSVLFSLTAITLVLLAAPVVMLLHVSPPVTLDDNGLEIQPLIGKGQRVAWSDVLAIKDYTLLPKQENEFERRMLEGRKKYRPVEGKMLVIRGLPAQYRVAGFFAGEHSQPIIALTSRTHTDYDWLIQRVAGYIAQHQTPAAAGSGK